MLLLLLVIDRNANTDCHILLGYNANWLFPNCRLLSTSERARTDSVSEAQVKNPTVASLTTMVRAMVCTTWLAVTLTWITWLSASPSLARTWDTPSRSGPSSRIWPSSRLSYSRFDIKYVIVFIRMLNMYLIIWYLTKNRYRFYILCRRYIKRKFLNYNWFKI